MEKEIKQKNKERETRQKQVQKPSSPKSQQSGTPSTKNVDAILRRLTENETKTARIVEKREEVIALMRSADEALVDYKEKISEKENEARLISLLEAKNEELQLELQANSESTINDSIETLGNNLVQYNRYINEYNNLIAKKEDDGVVTGEEITRLEKLETLLTAALTLEVQEYDDLAIEKNALQWFIVEGFSEKTKSGVELEGWEYAEEDFTKENIPIIHETEKVSDENSNVVSYTLNGFQVQLLNRNEVTKDKTIYYRTNKKARFNVLGPDGMVVKDGSNIKTLEKAEGVASNEATKAFEKTQKEFLEKNIDNKWVNDRVVELTKTINEKFAGFNYSDESTELTSETKNATKEIEKNKQEISALQNKLALLDKEIKNLETVYFFKSKDLIDPTKEVTEQIVAVKKSTTQKPEILPVLSDTEIKASAKQAFLHITKNKKDNPLHEALSKINRQMVWDKIEETTPAQRTLAEITTNERKRIEVDPDFLAELDRHTQNRENIAKGLAPMAEEELKNGPSEVEVPITSTPEISTAEPTPKTLTPEEEIEIKAQIEQITKRIEDRKKTIEKLNKDFEEKIKDIEQKIQEFEKEKRDNRTGEIKKLLDFFENFEVISNVPLVSQIGIPEEKLAKIATELKYKNIASMLGPVEFGTDTTISMAKKELIERLKNLIN